MNDEQKRALDEILAYFPDSDYLKKRVEILRGVSESISTGIPVDPSAGLMFAGFNPYPAPYPRICSEQVCYAPDGVSRLSYMTTDNRFALIPLPSVHNAMTAMYDQGFLAGCAALHYTPGRRDDDVQIWIRDYLGW